VIECLVDGLHGDEIEAVGEVIARRIGLGHDAPCESHLRCLTNTRRWLRGGADLAGKPDLSEDCRALADWPIPNARSHSRYDSQLASRLVHADSTSHVPEYVLAHQVEPDPFFEDRQQERQAVLIEAAGHASRVAVARRAHERLNLDKQRPRAFD